MSVEPARHRGAPADRVSWTANPILLWSAFLLAHLALGWLNLRGPGYPLGDVTSVYKFWSDQAVLADYRVGIDAPWVYPMLALVPMLAARVVYPVVGSVPALSGATLDADLYASTWLTLVLLLDLVAFGVLTGWGRRPDRAAAAWWWIGFLICFGPIALGRIDSITVPLAIVGVLLIATRPRAAAIVLTVGAWIKVWPGALVLAMVVAHRSRGAIAGAAAGVSAALVAIALALGSGLNVFGFVGEQAARGLQVEAPVTTYWMWRAASGAGDTFVYYDQDILTWQVRGPGASTAGALMTPLLVLAVIAVVLLGALVVRRGVTAHTLLPPLALALVAALIVTQKVGSPQFIGWLAVPVILGLVTRSTVSFRVPAVIVLVLGGLTHVIYPYLYGYLLGVVPWMMVVLTLRNALVVVLLGWAIVVIARLRASGVGPSTIDTSSDGRGSGRMDAALR